MFIVLGKFNWHQSLQKMTCVEDRDNKRNQNQVLQWIPLLPVHHLDGDFNPDQAELLSPHCLLHNDRLEENETEILTIF